MKVSIKKLLLRGLLLLSPWYVHAQILITEFMADNADTLQDQFGAYSDWVELCNTSSVPVNLEGWVVADKNSKSDKNAFTFPSYLLQPNAYIVIFASGTERKISGEPFHALFGLSKGGESLFLFSPITSTALQSITFGVQYTDYSYGVISPFRTREIITNGSPFKVAIPGDPVSWDGWTGNITNGINYSDVAWRSATNSVGALGKWTDVSGLSLRYDFTEAMTTNVLCEGPSGTSYTGTFNTAIASWQTNAADNGSVTRTGVMRFNGTEDSVGFRVPQVPAMGLSNTVVSFAFWMRSAGRVAGGRTGPECLIDVRSHPTYKSGNTIGLDASGRIVCQPRIEGATGATVTNSCTYVVNDGAWHHITVVQGQQTTKAMTFYIDGIFCGSTPTSIEWFFDSRIPITMGGLKNSESGYWHNFNGDLDDFRIYPRALSEAEVGQVMRNETQPADTQNLRIIAQDALALYYPFTNAPVNNVVTDSSGNNYIATNSAALWSGAITDGMATVRSGVMTFNGNKIRTPTSTNTTPLLYSQKGTIMFWMRSSVVGTGTGSAAAMLVDRRTTKGYVITQNSTGTIFIQPTGTGLPPSFYSTRNITDGYWHHISVTYDQTASGYLRLFIDGKEDASSMATAAWSWAEGVAIELGQSHDSYWKKFKGDMDDFRIYSRALSSAEIMTIAANGERALTEANISTLLPLPLADNTFFARYAFTVDQPNSTKLLTVNTLFQDGFMLFLNGIPLSSWNAPEPEELDRSSIATGAYSIFNPSFPIEIGLTTNLLCQGVNTLAFQVLRQSGVQADICLNVTASLIEVDLGSLSAGYMNTPSPGQENPISSLIKGPLVTYLAHTPKVPAVGQDVTVTVQTTDFALATASTATLYYRRIFESETNYPMTCISNTPPTRIWQATIPSSSLPTPENFWRYYVKITDTVGGIARYPAYGDPLAEPEYQGSITVPVTLESATLPIFRLFVSAANLSGMDAQYSGIGLGARCAVFYNDTLYDNVRIDVRGNTTVKFAKKSHSLKFNSGYALDYSPDMPKIRRTSFIAEYPDPSYARQSMSFWLMRQAGMAAPFHYPVHLRLNGAFYQMAFHSDRLSSEMTERFGFDPLGDIYKCVGSFRPDFYSTGGFEKIAPDVWETGMVNRNIICSNYFNFATAIQPSVAQPQRRINLLDQMDWTTLINYMAVAHLVQESDNVWANFCAYFDAPNTRRWKAIVYDMNLSWGAYYEQSTTGEYGANDAIKSHPLYGGAVVTGGNYNYLFDAIFADPELRSIYLRRLRTLLDTTYQSNDVPFSNRIIETEISRLTNSMAVDALADRTKWGWPASTSIWNWGTQKPSLSQGVQMLYDGFLTPHRNHYFGTHCVTNTAKTIGYGITLNAGIPAAQPDNIVILFGAYEICPASGNQEQEYLAFSNTNATPVDISGWQIKGGVTYTFPPATVIPAAASPSTPRTLILASSFQGFDSRTNSPKLGEGLYVVAGYSGKLSLRGENLSLVNTTGITVDTLATPVAPSLAQQYLRIAEIMYNPPVSQDREFIKLVNISSTTNVPLTGITFTEGIIYTFPTNTPALEPGASVILAKNATTFTTLYGFTPTHVFSGSINSSGELLRLLDAVGEKVQDVDYKDWYVSANGLGASIMAKDLITTPFNGFSVASAWYPSPLENGAPGSATNPPPFLSTVIVNELLAHTDLPAVDTVELYNSGDTAIDISGWCISDRSAGLTRFSIPNGTIIPSKGYQTFTTLDWSSVFEFNSEGGEGVYLSSASTNGFLTGYCHGFEFLATPNGVTLGRQITSDGKEYFPMQAAPSLGTGNEGPWVGPLIISQLDWHAPSPFIEIMNVGLRGTPSPVLTPYSAITQPDGSILLDNVRMEGDISFTFPAGSRIALDERLVITANQYTGTITTNGTGEIRLLMPDTQNVDGTIPLCLTEALSLKTVTPWPTTASNTNALHRHTRRFAADPNAWFSAAPCPGQASDAKKATRMRFQ